MIATNRHRKPLPLQDGTILAAAGTKGSVKEITSLDDRDQHLVERGLITVTESQVAPQVIEPPKPSPPDTGNRKEKV